MRAEATRRRLVVLDSNVWISAALRRAGTPAGLVRHLPGYGLPAVATARYAEREARLWPPTFDRQPSMAERRRLAHAAGAPGSRA